MKFYVNKDEIGADSKSIIKLSPEGYTGLLSEKDELVVAFKLKKNEMEGLELPTDLISLKFDSLDDLKSFINNIEKQYWSWEHGEE